MQIELKIDSRYGEPKVIVLTDKLTDEVNAILQKLKEDTPQMLAGFLDDSVQILDPSCIIRCYASNGKIYAVTEQGDYHLRLRLYELEERLDIKLFAFTYRQKFEGRL